jgi:very-short-patch-repair endonuclease
MWLEENNITYVPQKTFSNCINPDTKRRLRFDFYIPHKNLIIEFDGKQHFEVSNFCNDIELARELFEKTKKHDQIKNKFVKKSKMELLRISYVQFNKIEEILNNKIKQCDEVVTSGVDGIL